MSYKNFYRLLLQHHRKSTCIPVRLYGRWMHRTPAKVLLPFEPKSNVDLKKQKIISLDPKLLNAKCGKTESTEHKDDITEKAEDNKKTEIIMSPQKSKEIKAKRELKVQKRKFYLSQNKVFDENNEIIYEKLNANDGRISSLIVKLKSKKERLRSGQILVEGWRLIVDGLEAMCPLYYLIFSKVEDLNNLRPFLPKVGVKIFKMPYKEMELWSNVETSPGIFGIFEIPTPDNVKSSLQSLPLVFICDNIRDPGNLGAILRAAVGVGCEKILLTKGCVDVWDPKVIRSASGAHFRLPIHHSIDWEDMPKFLQEDTSIFIADSNAKYIDEDEEIRQEKLFGNQLPVLPYYSVEFSTFNNITIILGGETEGISEESYRFAASKNGLRLNIPLQKGVDSLNTGMATAVIAFEIRKHLLKALANKKEKLQVAQAT